MSWPDFIRLVGLGMAAFSFGTLVFLGLAPPGTTAFKVPWRYGYVATGILICVSGVVARISLWGEPFNVRDLVYLVVNVGIGVTSIGALSAPITPEVQDHLLAQARAVEAEMMIARAGFRAEIAAAAEELNRVKGNK